MAGPACFCGCGREVPFGRKRVTNHYGREFDKIVAILEGAERHGSAGEYAPRLPLLIAEGRAGREQLREVIHGERDRKNLDKDRLAAWMKEANEVRGKLAKDLISEDYVGWRTWKQSELLHAGRRAPGVIVAVGDTGQTLNNDPRVELRIRVEPEGEEPFEVTQRVTVSRIDVPRAGERLEVAYDPDDRENFTFRVGDLTDDATASAAAPASPVADPLDRLAKLDALRRSGALTDDEFAEQKARILADMR